MTIIFLGIAIPVMASRPELKPAKSKESNVAKKRVSGNDVKKNSNIQVQSTPEGKLLVFTTDGRLHEEKIVGRKIAGDNIIIEINKNKNGKYDVTYSVEDDKEKDIHKSGNLEVYRNICIKDSHGCIGYDTSLKAPVFINTETMGIEVIYFYPEE